MTLIPLPLAGAAWLPPGRRTSGLLAALGSIQLLVGAGPDGGERSRAPRPAARKADRTVRRPDEARDLFPSRSHRRRGHPRHETHVVAVEQFNRDRERAVALALLVAGGVGTISTYQTGLVVIAILLLGLTPRRGGNDSDARPLSSPDQAPREEITASDPELVG